MKLLVERSSMFKDFSPERSGKVSNKEFMLRLRDWRLLQFVRGSGRIPYKFIETQMKISQALQIA